VNELPPSSREQSLGNVFGTAIVGVIEYFERRYGPAAMHATIAKLPAKWRSLVKPNVPAMGVLGAKKYPNAFVGDTVRAMMAAVNAKDEDVFVREIGAAGLDRTLDTVARVLLRSIASPAAVARHAPELWRLYHDSGRLTITELGDRHYLSQVSEWSHHDVVLCKIGVEAGRRVVERTGVTNVEARREKCVAWGHDVCLTRVKWTP
jgi:hypothetical protein